MVDFVIKVVTFLKKLKAWVILIAYRIMQLPPVDLCEFMVDFLIMILLIFSFFRIVKKLKHAYRILALKAIHETKSKLSHRLAQKKKLDDKSKQYEVLSFVTSYFFNFVFLKVYNVFFLLILKPIIFCKWLIASVLNPLCFVLNWILCLSIFLDISIFLIALMLLISFFYVSAIYTYWLSIIRPFWEDHIYLGYSILVDPAEEYETQSLFGCFSTLYCDVNASMDEYFLIFFLIQGPATCVFFIFLARLCFSFIIHVYYRLQTDSWVICWISIFNILSRALYIRFRYIKLYLYKLSLTNDNIE